MKEKMIRKSVGAGLFIPGEAEGQPARVEGLGGWVCPLCKQRFVNKKAA